MGINRKNFLVASAILAAGVALSLLIIVAKPKPKPEDHLPAPPHIAEIIKVAPVTQAISINSQGTVTPKTEIDMTAQVAGQVMEISRAFAAGSFFKAGEVLVKLDSRDYDIALTKAEATLAEAQNKLAEERGQALQAKREWRDLGSEEANDLFLRKPQLAAAVANVEAAEAAVRQVKINLERTALSLPFDGRVMHVDANLGQYVASGAKVGRVYATDIMEVRLPMAARDMQLLNLKTDLERRGLEPMEVKLSFAVADRLYQWQGRVVRVEASVDSKSRLFHVVAEIDTRERNKNDVPPFPGLFVTAEITSNPYENLVILPRESLYRSRQLMLLNEENRLYLKEVEVLQIDAEQVMVRGLAAGDKVLAKPPSFIELDAVYTAVYVEEESPI